MKATTRVYPEKRKGITENVPLMLHIILDGKRTVFNTGFRCDISQWLQGDQKMEKGNINKAGISAATVNAKIKALRGTVDVWAVKNPNGTINDLLVELRKVADKKEKVEKATTDDFYSLFDKFLTERNYSNGRTKHYYVLKGMLKRFEAHTGSPISFTIDIALFKDFINNEHETDKTKKQRSENRIIGLLKLLKTFIIWAIKNKHTTINCFENVKIGSEIYGTPYFITIEERNHLYNFDFGRRKGLAAQRDIFVFQCLVGCRVGDLVRFTASNIKEGEFLEYIARKTSDEKPVTVRVPLTKTAKEIINRHSGGEMLLPFISETKYNEAIKDMFLKAGLTRRVTVRNPLTKTDEHRPLNEVASSHIARRTLIGNLYAKTQDPNVIGSMSGHVEGSRAFARYRKIDDDIKQQTINLID